MSLARTVVFPVDSSSNCHRAFNWYLKFGHKKNDEIIFLHIIQPTIGYYKQILPLDPHVRLTTESLRDDLGEAERTMEKFKGLAASADVKCREEVLVSSSPGETIKKFADEQAASVIVVGSRGAGKIRRTFLGTVSGYLVTHSTVPVLVVPPAPRHTVSASE